MTNEKGKVFKLSNNQCNSLWDVVYNEERDWHIIYLKTYMDSQLYNKNTNIISRIQKVIVQLKKSLNDGVHSTIKELIKRLKYHLNEQYTLIIEIENNTAKYIETNGKSNNFFNLFYNRTIKILKFKHKILKLCVHRRCNIVGLLNKLDL